MFIQCSNCEFKYLLNSADLKPNGRMVECANCNHQWFQDPDKSESFSSIPRSKKENLDNDKNNLSKKSKDKNFNIKNLPSTIVREEKPSMRNSIIALFILLCIFLILWFSRSYGINTLVLIDFYIREFIFNLNLIVVDLSKIIHNILN